MEGIARQYDLTKFFRYVLRGGGVRTPSHDCHHREAQTGIRLAPQEITIEFHFGGFGGPQIWPIEFYQTTSEVVDGDGAHIPVYPSFILGAWWLGSDFPADVIPGVTDATGSVHANSGGAEGDYEVELRLCIVPIGQALAATPALRVQISKRLPSTENHPVASSDGSDQDNAETTASKVAGRSNRADAPVPRIIKDYLDNDGVSLSRIAGGATEVRFLPIRGPIC